MRLPWQKLNWRLFRLSTVGILIATVLAYPAQGLNNPSDICIKAAISAAEEFNIPAEVLVAITLVETGREIDDLLAPWPWATNSGGKSGWHNSRMAAENKANAAIRSGTRNIDIGCFQLNYRWHGSSFASISAMFDPVENARYAARFLLSHFQKTSDWSLAAGAYHSRTKSLAKIYRDKFDAVRRDLRIQGVDLRNTKPKSNSYPLLVSGLGAAAPGSLVPVNDRSFGQSFIQNTYRR